MSKNSLTMVNIDVKCKFKSKICNFAFLEAAVDIPEMTFLGGHMCLSKCFKNVKLGLAVPKFGVREKMGLCVHLICDF